MMKKKQRGKNLPKIKKNTRRSSVSSPKKKPLKTLTKLLKKVKKPKTPSSLKVKKKNQSPSLYSQLRKEIRQEEKFLFLKEKNLLTPSPGRSSWETAQNFKVSFTQSQEINKRTNLTLRELAQARLARATEQQQKIS
jgi:hypothetical protein